MSAGFHLASGKHGERYVGKNTGIMNPTLTQWNPKMHDMKAQMKENTNERKNLLEMQQVTVCPCLQKFNNY